MAGKRRLVIPTSFVWPGDEESAGTPAVSFVILCSGTGGGIRLRLYPASS
jgi:hypothetical protein